METIITQWSRQFGTNSANPSKIPSNAYVVNADKLMIETDRLPIGLRAKVLQAGGARRRTHRGRRHSRRHRKTAHKSRCHQ